MLDLSLTTSINISGDVNVTIAVNHLTDKFKTMYAAVRSSVERVATSLQIDLSLQIIELIVVVIIVLFLIMLVQQLRNN